jgi:hypothetical protein
MSRTLKNILAAFTASTIGLATLSGSAFAGGSVSVTFVPTDADQTTAVHAGLAIYQLVNDLEDGSISQEGMNNIAGIAQNGFGNVGIIEQHGDGHNATLEQNGNGNSYGIFQFGEGASTAVQQNGNGQAGLTFGFGW